MLSIAAWRLRSAARERSRAPGSLSRGLAGPRSMHGEAAVAARGDLVAFPVIGAYTAGVGQHPARLALDIRAEIPGVGPGDECGIRGLVVMRQPMVFGILCRLDDFQILAAHVLDAVVDPLDLLLEAGCHVAQGGRRSERHGRREQVRIAMNL